MFLLLEAASQSLIFGFVPESIGVLLFGVGLILLTIGLRAVLRRGEKSADREIIHTTE